jgi:kinesin family protein 18/19
MQRFVVAVRVRPLTESERAKKQTSCCRLVLGEDGRKNGELIQISKRGSAAAHLRSQQGSTNEYAYDYSFGPDQTQQQVYENTTLPLIAKVLEGEKATVFAYGSTGAGKTHTMMGSMRTDEDLEDEEADGSGRGIIPRALVDTFAAIEQQKQLEANAGKKWVVSCSYLEVYNERIYDLLQPSSKALDVREDASGQVHVANLTDEPSGSASEVLELLLLGNRNRKTESTAANQVSSRSHAVLQLQVSCSQVDNRGATVTTKGKLSLIDLAGSERASATRNSGARLVEGAKINKSLLALANCINALAGGNGSGASSRGAASSRTPARSRLQRLRPGSSSKRKTTAMKVNFRDSKLTHLLKPSLTGEAHVVMVANVNPSHLFYEDSHNTLKYANRAKNIKIDPAAAVATRSEHSAVDRAILLQQENERLRAAVSRMQSSSSTPLPVIQRKDGSSSLLGKRSRGSTGTDKREPKRRLSDQNRAMENIQLKERVKDLETDKLKMENLITSLETQLARASVGTPGPVLAPALVATPVPLISPALAKEDEERMLMEQIAKLEAEEAHAEAQVTCTHAAHATHTTHATLILLIYCLQVCKHLFAPSIAHSFPTSILCFHCHSLPFQRQQLQWQEELRLAEEEESQQQIQTVPAPAPAGSEEKVKASANEKQQPKQIKKPSGQTQRRLSLRQDQAKAAAVVAAPATAAAVAPSEECASEKKQGRYFLRRLRTPGKETRKESKSLSGCNSADRARSQQPAEKVKSRKKRHSMIPKPSMSALATPARGQNTIECDPSSRRRSNRSRRSLIPRPRGGTATKAVGEKLAQQENCNPNALFEDPTETW